MVIYGTSRPKIKTAKSATGICPNCKSQFTLSYTIYRKHVHLFWIPIFPLKKKGLSECSNCKNILNEKEMPESLKAELNEIKADAKGPIWQFAGLLLILLLSIWIYQNDGEKTAENLSFIQNPQVGDVYKYKVRRGAYSTMKVVSVSSDSVFILFNEYESNKVMGIPKIEKSKNYSDEVFGMSRASLLEMHTDGDLFDIDRKEEL